MKIARTVAAAVCAALALAGSPAAYADHDENHVVSTPCDRTIYVFFMNQQTVAGETVDTGTTTPEAACLAVTDADGVDPRLVDPTANALSVRVTYTVPEDAESVFGRVIHPNGDVTEIELTPTLLIDGSCCLLDSPRVPIDPSASGYYGIEVDIPLDETGTQFLTYTDEYRTVGQPSRAPGFIP